MEPASAPRTAISRSIALGLLATFATAGELWLALDTPTGRSAIAVTIVIVNAAIALYATYAIVSERRSAERLMMRVSAEQSLKETLEQRVTERTAELDDAQRVLHRMWWLGQQITLELDPQRVLERFLEAVVDVAKVDGAALGLVADEGNIELAASSGILSSYAGSTVPVAGSVMGWVVRTGRTWCVNDMQEHLHEVTARWFLDSKPPIRGTAILPVHRRGERIGAVTIVCHDKRTFAPLELERVEAMTDLLSVALANAELFDTMKRTEWRFRTLFRAAPDAVLTLLHATGRIREANDAVREVFGIEPAQIVGKPLIELLVADDRPTLERALSTSFAGTPSRAEVQVMTPTGKPRVVALAISRLPEADPPSVLLIGRDMTQERELRLRLMESDRLAAVGELVAGVAHEVNNPLSSISAFAQLLLREPSLSLSQRESLEVIRGETQRASQVVKDLLTFARRSEPQRAPLDLNGVVSRTVKMRQFQLDLESIRVDLDLADDLPSVLGDSRQLQQVCLNLVTNAVQAMAPGGGGTLRLCTSVSASNVRLDVRDTGPGIAPTVRAHIFEPFFTTKKEGEGTGLGLSVSYGIVAAHGGTIEVVDTGPEGTTFRLMLPSVSLPPLTADGHDDSPLNLRSPLAGIRLLFVDDEPVLRSGMQAFGAMRGFSVVVAEDGNMALEIARQTAVDAVVCDLRMPGMDGYAFHEALGREHPGLAARTIFITGDVVSSAAGRGSNQPVLTKPFTFEKVEETLINVMRVAPIPGVGQSRVLPG